MSSLASKISALEDYTCPLSLDRLGSSDIYLLQCGHSFSDDLIQCLAQKTLKQCPTCRAPIEENYKPSKNWALQTYIVDTQNCLDLTTQKITKLKFKNTDLKQMVITSCTNVNNLSEILKNLMEQNSQTLKMLEECHTPKPTFSFFNKKKSPPPHTEQPKKSPPLNTEQPKKSPPLNTEQPKKKLPLGERIKAFFERKFK